MEFDLFLKMNYSTFSVFFVFDEVGTDAPFFFLARPNR